MNLDHFEMLNNKFNIAVKVNALNYYFKKKNSVKIKYKRKT